MNKTSFFVGILFLGLVIAGGIFLWGQVDDEIKNNDYIINNGTIPKDYDVLNKNPEITAEIPEERRKVYEDEFNETLKTINEHPDSFLAWMNLATIKNTFGDYKGAEEAWLYATAISPNQGRSLVNLGDLYWNKLHDFPRADWAYMTALDREPVNTRIYRDLASLYQFSYVEKKHLAIPMLLTGVENNPDDHAELLALAGLWEWQNGNIANAIIYYEQYLTVKPDDEVAQGDLATLRSLK